MLVDTIDLLKLIILCYVGIDMFLRYYINSMCKEGEMADVMRIERVNKARRKYFSYGWMGILPMMCVLAIILPRVQVACYDSDNELVLDCKYAPLCYDEGRWLMFGEIYLKNETEKDFVLYEVHNVNNVIMWVCDDNMVIDVPSGAFIKCAHSVEYEFCSPPHTTPMLCYNLSFFEQHSKNSRDRYELAIRSREDAMVDLKIFRAEIDAQKKVNQLFSNALLNEAFYPKVHMEYEKVIADLTEYIHEIRHGGSELHN